MHTKPQVTPAVALQRVNFAYNTQLILEDVNLTVAKGDLVSIVGPNGGGKTTLVRLILGLLKPRSGNIQVFGQRPENSRLRVGYMPQHLKFDAAFPMSAIDVVLMARLGRKGLSGLFGWYSREDRQVAVNSLHEVDMESYADRPFSTLSGGQRQRVLIARALCCNPDLLLLDEPTANVDTRAGSQLEDILLRLNKRMTIMIVSHDLGFVSHIVGHVICVNRSVAIHPTNAITGEMINTMYGSSVHVVRHDNNLSQQGPT